MRSSSVQHVAHEHRLGGQREVAGLDPEDVEDLVDQAQRSVCPSHVVHNFLLVVVDALDVENLREAEDGVEWRAQLVAHT